MIKSRFEAFTPARIVVNNYDLEGWNIIVTGGASGIGVETARALAGAGADVMLAVRDRVAGERVAADWPGFCRETARIFDMLAVRVEREERELYPLADKLYAAAAVDAAVRAGSPISS